MPGGQDATEKKELLNSLSAWNTILMAQMIDVGARRIDQLSLATLRLLPLGCRFKATAIRIGFLPLGLLNFSDLGARSRTRYLLKRSR